MLEIDKQFDKIINSLNKYFFVRNDKSVNEGFSSSSSDDEDNINENKDLTKERKIFISNKNLDNLLYDYNPRYYLKKGLNWIKILNALEISLRK